MSVSDFHVDFFLAGFPKCGTTTIARYLAAHPNVCFASIKEPGFFCPDFQNKRKTTSQDAYQRLFQPTPKTKLFGEGTVIYVYSDEALNRILQHNPEAKLILMLRNPIELVHSLHANQLRVFEETFESIEDAWDIQEARQEGKNIPRLCEEPFFLQYKKAASQGAYLKRVYERFPAEQILILFFDDLKVSVEAVYLRTLNFLELDCPSTLPSFAPANENLTYKTGLRGMLGIGIRCLSKNQTLMRMKSAVGIGDLSSEKLIRRMSMQPAQRDDLPLAFKMRLADEFKSDVELLSDITSRDLSHWLELL